MAKRADKTRRSMIRAIDRTLNALANLDWSFGRAQKPEVQAELDAATDELRKFVKKRKATP